MKPTRRPFLKQVGDSTSAVLSTRTEIRTDLDWWIGFGLATDMYPEPHRPTFYVSDLTAFWSDWLRIGHDMETALERVQESIEQRIASVKKASQHVEAAK